MRTIDADALKEFIDNGRVCDICDNKKPLCLHTCDFPDYLTPLWEKVIDNAPTIERPTGHWISIGGTMLSECSECEVIQNLYDMQEDNFCPNCGADMRGGTDNGGV